MSTFPKIAAIILAAGVGRRMNAPINKVWLNLNGRQIIDHTLGVFQENMRMNRIILVVHQDEIQTFQTFLDTAFRKAGPPIYLVAGGKERQDSVVQGLQFLQRQVDWGGERLVAIHDAARPLITADLLDRVVDMAIRHRAAGLAVPVKDTIKRVDQNGWVLDTPDRSLLWAMQTPQVFDYELVLKCYHNISGLQRIFSDDCSVVEYNGYPVRIVPGSYENLKITTPEDIAIAEGILRRREDAGWAGI